MISMLLQVILFCQLFTLSAVLFINASSQLTHTVYWCSHSPSVSVWPLTTMIKDVTLTKLGNFATSYVTTESNFCLVFSWMSLSFYFSLRTGITTFSSPFPLKDTRIHTLSPTIRLKRNTIGGGARGWGRLRTWPKLTKRYFFTSGMKWQDLSQCVCVCVTYCIDKHILFCIDSLHLHKI